MAPLRTCEVQAAYRTHVFAVFADTRAGRASVLDSVNLLKGIVFRNQVVHCITTSHARANLSSQCRCPNWWTDIWRETPGWTSTSLTSCPSNRCVAPPRLPRPILPRPNPAPPRPTLRRADLPPVSHSANLAVPELLESETDLPSCSSCVASSRSIFHFSKDMAAGRCRTHQGIVEKQIMHCTNCLCLPAIELLVGTLTARPGESCCRPGSCA